MTKLGAIGDIGLVDSKQDIRDNISMAQVAQPTDSSESSEAGPSGNLQSGQPEGAISPTFEQPNGRSEAAVANQQTQTETRGPYDLRDVIAQEIMADAAFWMTVAAFLTFIVTSIGTLLIRHQVKLTREAVEDTGKATKAMERQNDLTTIAQRPWIKLSARVTKLEVKELGFDISIAVDAQNLGKSVAENTRLWATLVQADDVGHVIADTRAKVEDSKRVAAQVIPGEATTHWSKGGYSNEHVKRVDYGSGPRAPLLIFAAARYFIPGDPEPRVTERAFSIVQGEHEDPFAPIGLGVPVHSLLEIGDLIVLPAGHTRAS